MPLENIGNLRNYGEIKQAISLWLNRTDLGLPVIGSPGTPQDPDDTVRYWSIIETFIALAERKIFRHVRCAANEKMARYVMPEEQDYILVPSDMLQAKDLFVDDNAKDATALGSGIPYEYVDEYHFKHKDMCNPSTSYTRILNTFKFNHALAKDSVVNLYYWADLSGMNEDEDSNEILRIAPDAYLFGALTEAEAYIVNDQRIPIWHQKFELAMKNLMDYSQQMDWSSSPIIMR